MKNSKAYIDRNSLLADIAEMYYLDGKDQSAIAKEIGVTRSMISKLLSLARARKIVEIRINRHLQFDHGLENSISTKFSVKNVTVVKHTHQDYKNTLGILGQAAAEVIKKTLQANSIIGVAWGSTPSATVDALDPIDSSEIRVVQLIGAMGAQNTEYDGHALVARLSEKLAAEPFYINAPYICLLPEVARQMKETPGIKETIEMATRVDIALLGIGTIDLDYSSYYLSGLLSKETILNLQASGVVGDVASHFFCMDGTRYKDTFMENLITIDYDDLIRIPLRIGVAGGPGKVKAIIGALKAGLVNSLVTDSFTAQEIILYSK